MSTQTAGKRKATDDEPVSAKKAKMSPTSIAKFTRGEVIKIPVGPEKAEFVVHESLLIEQSPFFAAKAKLCWTEAERGVDLENIDVEGFGIVIDWMYRRELPAVPSIILINTSEENDAIVDFHHTIRKAY